MRSAGTRKVSARYRPAYGPAIALTDSEPSRRAISLLPYPRPVLRRLDPCSPCYLRRLGKHRQPLSIVAVTGLNESGRHDELGGGLDWDVEFDDGAARHEEKESGRRVRGAGHEHRDVLLAARQARRDFLARPLRQKHQRPHAGRRKLHQADGPKG